MLKKNKEQNKEVWRHDDVSENSWRPQHQISWYDDAEIVGSSSSLKLNTHNLLKTSIYTAFKNSRLHHCNIKFPRTVFLRIHTHTCTSNNKQIHIGLCANRCALGCDLSLFDFQFFCILYLGNDFNRKQHLMKQFGYFLTAACPECLCLCRASWFIQDICKTHISYSNTLKAERNTLHCSLFTHKTIKE